MTRARSLLPWAVWTVAALSYAVAIINRSSLAALGPAAQDHFGIDATTLSAFPVIQLIVYAGLQIPVGILLDRVGATTMILIGGVLMIAGQVTMATVPDVGLAILARVLVGAGDACSFISVMRMLPEWFPARQLPTVSQLTGLVGQAGQLVSVTPLALMVAGFGWASGFLAVAALGFLVTLLAALVLRDSPGTGTAFERMTGRPGGITRRSVDYRPQGSSAASDLAPPATGLIEMPPQGPVRRGLGFWHRARRLLRLPGVRLAYWVHFTSPFASNAFILLWGTPFLVGGIGLSRGAAAGLLSLTILSSMAAGFLLGPLTSRFLERRVGIAASITVAIALVWIAVLLWPGTPPTWLLVLLMVVMPIGGPASMISFEVGRSHTPRSFSGFGTGLVNTAGFTATLLVILLIGLVLDVQGAGSPEHYSLGAFRVAFAVQLPFWVLGLVFMGIEYRKTKRWMDEQGRRLR